MKIPFKWANIGLNRSIKKTDSSHMVLDNMAHVNLMENILDHFYSSEIYDLIVYIRF